MAVRTTRSEKLDLRLTRNAKRALQAAADSCEDVVKYDNISGVSLCLADG